MAAPLNRSRVLFVVLALAVVLTVGAAGVVIMKGAGKDQPERAPAPKTVEEIARVAVGESVTYHGATVSITQVQQPTTLAGLPRPPAGVRWTGVKVHSCAAQDAQPLPANWYRFNGTDRRGNLYPALVWNEDSGIDPSEWTFDRYPQFAKIRPGHCERGWLLLVSPENVRLTNVIETDDDGTVTGVWELDEPKGSK